ncbi:MAG: SH3 domain-containing protein [Deferribacteraceae bacterium]|jgi:hypothetical protein|nr:SH3 domain-containing protein [Deferribacteraceae bacterium]
MKKLLFIMLFVFVPALAYAQTAIIQGKDGYANMYTGAGTQYGVNQKLENGTSVTIETEEHKTILGKSISVQGDWYFVRTETGSTGFVHSDMLRIVGKRQETADPNIIGDYKMPDYYCSTGDKASLDIFLDTVSFKQQDTLIALYLCRPTEVLAAVCTDRDILQMLDSQLNRAIDNESESKLNQVDSLLFLKYKVNKCQRGR